MGKCKKDVTPLLKHWSCVYLALTHRFTLSGIISIKVFFSSMYRNSHYAEKTFLYVHDRISFADKTLWLFWMRPAPGFPRDDGHSMPFLWRWHWHYQSYGFSTQIFSLDAFMQKHICLIGSKDAIGCVRLMCQVAVWDRLLHSPSLVAGRTVSGIWGKAGAAGYVIDWSKYRLRGSSPALNYG